MKKPCIDKYIRGDAALPVTFTTGYQKDLAIAREIIQARRESADQLPGNDRPVSSSRPARAAFISRRNSAVTVK